MNEVRPSKIILIGVPSSAGARRTGQDRAPELLQNAGLIDCLTADGIDVLRFVHLAHAIFRPDPANPRQQNLPLVIEVAKRVAQQVSVAIADNVSLIIVGGDCTITLGVLAGMVSHLPNLGLVYFDGDVDLNTPETTASGIFDGMVMSHIVGDGAKDLSHIGARYPLMAEENIILFGYNPDSGWIDPAEIQRLNESSMLRYSSSQIRGKAACAATEALAQLDRRVQHLLVHFDVDVIDRCDFPAADVLHDHGLNFDEAIEALNVFISSPKFVGLVVTEFNADRDLNGNLARRLVEALGRILTFATDKKRGDGKNPPPRKNVRVTTKRS